MQAFHQAILAFNSEKGYFISFARLVIKRRLLNYLQKSSKYNKEITFSQLEFTDNDGNVKEFEIEDLKADYFDNPLKLEIEAIKLECLPYNINFLKLENSSPKAQKTKLLCMKITDLVASDKELLSSLKRKTALPAVKIIKQLKISKKVLEHHRHYLIAVIIIKTGDYPYLKEYLKLGDKN